MSGESQKRTFQFAEGTSDKFWEVWTDGCDVTTHWGRTGTDGQSKTKSYDSEQAAENAAEKAVALKLKKGYSETTVVTEDVQTEVTPTVQTEVHAEEASSGGTAETLGGRLRNALAQLTEKVGETFAQHIASGDGPPTKISLAPAEPDSFPATSLAARCTDEICDKGFELCGDYTVEQLGITVRAFFLPPNVFATVYKLGVIEWIELTASYFNDNRACWSSQLTHDGITPPWVTLKLLPAADFSALHAQMVSDESGQAPELYSKDDFVGVFVDAYEKEMAWRLSDTAEMEEIEKEAGDDETAESLAKDLYNQARDYYMYGNALNREILNKLEKLAKNETLSEKACKLLRRARDSVKDDDYFYDDEEAKQQLRIDALVGDDRVRIPIRSGEVWANQVISDIGAMQEKLRVSWLKLIRHCVTATASKPTAKWRKTVEPLLQALPDFSGQLREWLSWLDKPKDTEPDPRNIYQHPLAIVEPNQNVLRGLVWCYSFVPDDELPRVLATAGISAYRKIPQIGERATRVGNACVFAIGGVASMEAVAQLALLKMKAKTATARKLIERQLDKTAEQQGVSRSELEEMAVPTYGMEEVGLREESLGEFTAVLHVQNQKTELQWRGASGKVQKSVPAAVKRDHADDLKELKAAAKDIDKMLSAQKQRVESLYVEPRTWPLAQWKERYLDHPLVGTIARRLLWSFQNDPDGPLVAGFWKDDRMLDRDGSPLELAETATVQLWHPLSEPAEEVLAWRIWLEDQAISQPFKQAHREIYLLTDAEQQTGIYSNRFAAHILSQSQYRTLAQSRLWKVNFLGHWDGGDDGLASRTLDHHDVRAEFWVNAVESEEDEYGVTYVSTDQVRFYLPADANEPADLPDVPSIVFSEIMRDVDLFVGVASVGNDPTWVDGGPDGAYRDYWHTFSFGELSASAKTRRETLERLLPRLKIADRCTIQDRFLIVQGDLRTYKIHLGSGNILMEPNDQYLCIVSSRRSSAVERMSLPFEGDTMFSVILSKAFLLADDAKIKDSTILSQIGR